MNRQQTKEYKLSVLHIAAIDPAWLYKSYRTPSSVMLKCKRAMAINRRVLRLVGYPV